MVYRSPCTDLSIPFLRPRVGVPRTIESELDKDNPVQCVAFGEDGAWFYKEAPRNGAKPYGEISALLEQARVIGYHFTRADAPEVFSNSLQHLSVSIVRV